MTTKTALSVIALALALGACGERPEPEPSGYAGGARDEGEESAAAPQADADAEEPAAQDEAAPEAADEPQGDRDPELRARLEAAVREACDPENEDWAQSVPENASFVARLASSEVLIACNFDGSVESWSFRLSQMPDPILLPLQDTFTEHLRHNLRPGDDRSTTGAFRHRDGGFCTLQMDEPIARSVCDAAETAEAAMAALDDEGEDASGGEAEAE